MNWNMCKVLPGLYVGNYRDSKDFQQLEKFNISHIVAIHDSPKRLLPDKHYLCVMAADTPDQNLSQYFPVCNDFIHAARLRDGNVLIHCLAGMSRSVTVAVAYIMAVTNLNWKESLKVVRAGRSVANPNLGFQTQLQDYEFFKLPEERRRLRERFPSLALEQVDKLQCANALSNYEELLLNKDICEGNCSRGEKCPTGLCNADSSKGIFRRKASTSSTRSRLAPSTASTQSCPNSPKYVQRPSKEVEPPQQQQQQQQQQRNQPQNHYQQQQRKQQQFQQQNVDEFKSQSTTGYSSSSSTSAGLRRSASTISGCRPRSSPAGLYSYTAGSAPTSVHGSRLDLAQVDKGSAIYLGCSPPRTCPVAGSTWSVTSTSKIGTSGNSAPQTPINTPPVSPRHGMRRINSNIKKI